MSATDALESVALLDASPQATAHRLVVTWQHPEMRGIQPVGFLSQDDGRYRFHYIRSALTVEGFRPLLGFGDLRQQYEADELFPLFAQRAMDQRRPDYLRYVAQLGLPVGSSPWEQIARSGGRRQGDLLGLVPVPWRAGGALTVPFLVSGVRWIADRTRVLEGREVVVTVAEHEQRLRRLVTGDELGLVDEPANQANPGALMTCTVDGVPLGYVPDLLVEDLRELRRTSSLDTAVVTANHEAPSHLRLLARITAAEASDYEFFTGDRWQPFT